jgi:hypothetical protein
MNASDKENYATLVNVAAEMDRNSERIVDTELVWMLNEWAYCIRQVAKKISDEGEK